MAGQAAAPVPDFASFFRANFANTARSVESIVGTAAEDVAQEAFIAALSRWDTVVNLEAPDAWLRLVAKRIAWRRRSREISRRELEAAAHLPAVPPHDWTLGLDIERALEALPDRQRAAVRLYYQVDQPVGSIAQILDCTEAAVKVWLHRARERLAEDLMGHRGKWISEHRWRTDDIVAALRRTGDSAFIPIVLEEVPTQASRWALTLHSGSYAIESDEGEKLDWGRYRVKKRTVVLTPWNQSGRVLIRPTIDGGQAKFALLANTSAPTRGVPDEVYMRILLASDTFAWDGTP